jgi:PAS domain S-box-containing protein
MMKEPAENLYHDLVECQQDLIVKFSPEGKLLFVNTAYCETLGRPKDQLLGSVFMPVTSERYADVLATQMTKLFRPPYSCIVEQWLQTPKGMRCISWSAKSVLNRDNNIVSIVATGRDITKAKQELKELRKRDQDLMLVVESGKEMYYSHTPDNIMRYVSPRIRQLLGCRPGSGKWSWTDYLTEHPLNAQGVERTARAAASGRREPLYRMEMATGDGRTVWVEVNEIPVVRHGKTVAIAGSMVDVTEKMSVEEGEAEAEILFKGTGGDKRSGPVRPAAPLGFIKSLLSKEDDEERDEGVV